MSLKDNYVCLGQMSIFDIFSQDILYGKTSTEPSVPITERTSEQFSRKQSKWQTKTPMFLDLRKDKDGRVQDASWVTDIALLGECMTHNTGEYHSEGDAYVYSLTMGGQQHQRYYLNFSEKPSITKPTKLSQILEENPDPKYNLSPRACMGILNRAKKRGKELPKLLKIALEKQAGLLASKNEQESQGGGKGILIQDEKMCTLSTLNNQSICYGISSHDSNAMKSPNPHSGIYEADTTRTLDLQGGNPACNQGGMAVVCIEGNGSRESHQGDGYKESETMYTLNTIEQHAVAYSSDRGGGKSQLQQVSKDFF